MWLGCSGEEPVAPAPSTAAELMGPDSTEAVAGEIALQVGDDFQQANDSNPAGSRFFVAAGIHAGQRVVNPKPGNQWRGQEGAILDGADSLSDAFSGRAEEVTIAGLALRNYVDNGVYFRDGRAVRISRVQVSDTGSGDGEANGALRFLRVRDLAVTGSFFSRVSSGVLPTQCIGPIRIEGNSGVNTGRNFIQLANCRGGGIRVRYNSMERVGDYLRPGAEDVEDWISVFDVVGLPEDPAQLNFNRARGHGVSASGSFIMLGDGGGQYQEAVGNIGVTPGQVGIGLSGGEYIAVRDNVIFSDIWAQSNIAFYSSNYAGAHPCGHHTVENNRANWTNRDRRQNTFWSNDTCAPLSVRGNSFPDSTVGAEIWDQWQGVPVEGQ